MLRKMMPGGVPSNSLAKNLRAARSSIRSRSLMNCASRWSGLDRATPSRSSIAEVEMAQVELDQTTIDNMTAALGTVCKKIPPDKDSYDLRRRIADTMVEYAQSG